MNILSLVRCLGRCYFELFNSHLVRHSSLWYPITVAMIFARF